jgi:Zn-dependent protease with chaperone function
MDFFEAQDVARRRTHLLVLLFLAAVAAIIIVVYLVVHMTLGPGPTATLDVGLLALVAFGVGVLIAGGSGFRTMQLRQGGPAVARLLGGTEIGHDTSDPDERRLVNIVEEMAIASGTPVPAIFVLRQEDGINAFAAGYTLHDAAVAVTGGALRRLNRDEMQGVMAHEFSHILNGDMRLNVRLMGVLFGILLLAIVGRGLLRSGFYRGRGRKNDGGGQIAILGIALLAVGYIGVFFGKLIKAAVSRQREYLADAAAVQFTRNPDGIAGALKKIGGFASGSRIADHHAEEASHFFFASGLGAAFSGLLSTHPPLDDRIRRIDPSFQGDYPKVAEGRAATVLEDRAEGRAAGLAGAAAGAAGPRAPLPAAGAGPEGGDLAERVAGLMASVGVLDAAQVAYAGRLIEAIPPAARDAARSPTDAPALVMAILASAEPDAAAAERAVVAGYGGEEFAARVDGLAAELQALPAEARLPLVDLALPALRRLDPPAARRFREAIEALIHADGRIRIHEFALYHIVERQLAPPEERTAPGRGGANDGFPAVRREVEAVLSAVAWSGARSTAAAAGAFDAGAGTLPVLTGKLRLLDAGEASLRRLSDALVRLEAASPAVRRRFLEACGHVAGHDGEFRVPEVELLRAIAEALDCPMPPLPGRV